MNTTMRYLMRLTLLLMAAACGMYFANADEKQSTAKAQKPSAEAAKPVAGDAKDGLHKLVGPGFEGPGKTLREVFDFIEDQTDYSVRVDVEAYLRAGYVDIDRADWKEPFVKNLGDTKVNLPRKTARLTLDELLREALSSRLPLTSGDAVGPEVPAWPATYQIRGTQIFIVPAYAAPFALPGKDPLGPPPRPLPGQDVGDEVIVPLKVISAQVNGPTIVLAAEKKPLSEILADLRKQTCANIVLDPRAELDAKLPLTMIVNDVRLYDALRVLADMAGLKLIYYGNMYYITSRANAKEFFPPQPLDQPGMFGQMGGGMMGMHGGMMGTPGPQVPGSLGGLPGGGALRTPGIPPAGPPGGHGAPTIPPAGPPSGK